MVVRESGGQTPLTETFRAHGVDGTVVFGGITEVGSRPLGSLTFELQAPEGQVDALLAELRTWTEVVEYADDGVALSASTAPRVSPTRREEPR